MKNLRWKSCGDECEAPLVNDPCGAPPSRPSFLETVENRIYFYSEINRENVLQLSRTLKEKSLDLFLRSKQLGFEELPKLYLHIYSYGGSLHAGLAAMDHILNCVIPVHTIIDGACASAATLLSVVGSKRLIHRNAFILIHQVSTFFWGKHEELKDEMSSMEKFMEVIKRIYGQYTKLPPEKLEEILKHDLWLTADEALQYGLVDEII